MRCALQIELIFLLVYVFSSCTLALPIRDPFSASYKSHKAVAEAQHGKKLLFKFLNCIIMIFVGKRQHLLLIHGESLKRDGCFSVEKLANKIVLPRTCFPACFLVVVFLFSVQTSSSCFSVLIKWSSCHNLNRIQQNVARESRDACTAPCTATDTHVCWEKENVPWHFTCVSLYLLFVFVVK